VPQISAIFTILDEKNEKNWPQIEIVHGQQQEQMRAICH
jgi:hypothetical protein